MRPGASQKGSPVRVVGLTGGMGAGKSEVLRLIARRGFPVLQADQVGHALLRDRRFARRLEKSFGPGLLDGGGGVNRRKLAAAVFPYPAKRRALNQLLHPVIRRKIKEWVRERKKDPKKTPLAVVEIPLLFEGKGYPYLDGVLSVSAPREARHRRLRARGWDAAEIRRREKGQWPQARKDRKAHWVLPNGGSRGELRRRVDRWLQNFLSPRPGPGGRHS